jgi:signal transduction histidine kinase
VTDASRLLVVDDNDAGRFAKAQTLRRAGFDIVEASTGAEALSAAERIRPDLVVLDVNLPDISGFDVTRRLRALDAPPPALQILQISSTALAPADRVRGLEQGADVYLVEPVEPEVLVATVRSLLRVRRAETAMSAALERERRARALAEEAGKLREEFIATLSHELRTPLNASMGWIWQLRHTKLGEAAYGRALDSLERNARMQAQLINDLLDVSRVSKGKLHLQMRCLDLRTVIEDVAESIAEPTRGKALDLRLDLESICVAGDAARLQQIVTNLMTNAVQFTPPDGRVTVALRADAGDAVLTVDDSGAGIDPSFLPFVFDQFRQGEGGLTRKHGGLGLGLTVVQQLVELHGGSVTVTSPGSGQGSRFTVRLPREKASACGRRMQEAPLILYNVRVRLDLPNLADAESLRAVLESSGALVIIGNSEEPGDYDMLLKQDDSAGPLRFSLKGPSEAWTSIRKSASQGDLVRQLGRAFADTTAPRAPAPLP